MRSADELALYEGLRLGSERAFRRLVAGHHAALLRLAGLYVDDATAQEELVRWTWSTALHGLGMFTWHTSFRAWPFGILVAHGRARPTRPTPPPPSTHPPTARTAPAPVDWAGLAWSPRWSSEGWRALEGALAALPLARREAVHLRDVEGWPAPEADAALGVTAEEGGHLLAEGRAAVTAAVRAWLGLPAPGPDPVVARREVDGVTELLGLLNPDPSQEAAAPVQLVVIFRDWRASRRIPAWRRLRGAYLARTGGRRYAPRVSAGSGGA